MNYELFRFEQWPPFLVDLLPGGACRRAWLRRMQAENDGPQMDWHLLTKGAGAPPGNLRIAEAVLTPPPDHFKLGFPRRDIIEQREHFLDYAEERGAHVAGASSVQGEAPKYLLAEDHGGMFHAEGALSDEKIKKFWLVKFPRGSLTDERNQQVLRNTDNHGRNTAVLRTNGQVKLSPIFDFAPMFLDPVGIGRVSRWENERPGNQPEWAVICEKLKNLMAPIETRAWLADLGEDVKQLPETMQDCHVDDDIIQRLAGWIDEVAAGLVEIQPRTWT